MVTDISGKQPKRGDYIETKSGKTGFVISRGTDRILIKEMGTDDRVERVRTVVKESFVIVAPPESIATYEQAVVYPDNEELLRSLRAMVREWSTPPIEKTSL